jgi:NAD-dependent SIR2 family protein deacetylase
MSAPQRFVDQHGQQRTIRCSQCRKVCRGTDGGWNLVLEAGEVTGFLCPTCQSPEENAEAEIHAATLEYGRDPIGRIVGRPR